MPELPIKGTVDPRSPNLIVDVDIYDQMSQHEWFQYHGRTGYIPVRTEINGRTVYAHRMAWMVAHNLGDTHFPGWVRVRNGNWADCRMDNLEMVAANVRGPRKPRRGEEKGRRRPGVKDFGRRYVETAHAILEQKPGMTSDARRDGKTRTHFRGVRSADTPGKFLACTRKEGHHYSMTLGSAMDAALWRDGALLCLYRLRRARRKATFPSLLDYMATGPLRWAWQNARRSVGSEGAAQRPVVERRVLAQAAKMKPVPQAVGFQSFQEPNMEMANRRAVQMLSNGYQVDLEPHPGRGCVLVWAVKK